ALNGAVGGAVIHSGHVTFSAGSTLFLAQGHLPGPVEIDATGTVSLAGCTLHVDDSFVLAHLSEGIPLPIGTTFPILTSTGGLSGTFNNPPDNAVLDVAGVSLRIHYTATGVSLTRTFTFPAGLSPTQRYVTQLYRDLLQREPDAAGLASFST